MSWVAVAIGGSAVIGAGSSMYAANKAANGGPAPRNVSQEYSDLLGTYKSSYPQFQQLQDQYGGTNTSQAVGGTRSALLGDIDVPKFLQQHPEFQEGWDNNGGDRAWLQRAMDNAPYLDQSTLPRAGGVSDVYSQFSPTIDRLNTASATTQRTGDVQDFATLAPQLEAAKRAANPEAYAALGSFENWAGTPTTATEGETALSGYNRQLQDPDAIESTLSKQAQDELALNGQLSDQETRDATAAARAAYSARGLGDSNSALAGEVLNLDSARRARQDASRTFASGVESMRLGRLNQGTSTASSLANAGATRQSLDLSKRSAALQARLGFTTQPYDLLGRPISNTLTTGQSFAQGQSLSGYQAPPDFNSLLAYGNDVNNTNFNAASAKNIASSNAYASMGGSLIGGAGQVAAAYYGKKS